MGDTITRPTRVVEVTPVWEREEEGQDEQWVWCPDPQGDHGGRRFFVSLYRDDDNEPKAWAVLADGDDGREGEIGDDSYNTKEEAMAAAEAFALGSVGARESIDE